MYVVAIAADRAESDYPLKLTIPKPSPVGGRLQQFWEVWEKKGASPYIVKLLKEGLTLEFSEPPPLVKSPIFMDSYKGDPIRRQALKSALEELVQKNVLEQVRDVNSPGFYGRLFIRPKTEGKWRSIIDLSDLNHYIVNPSFQMETSWSIQNSMRQGMWATSIDLSDAYFHIPVHPKFRKFMRIALFDQVLQFRAMPMGLNVSARVFTKVMGETLKMIRAEQVLVHGYIDDWIFRNYIRLLLREQTVWSALLTTELGWLINLKKSELWPKQIIKYCGVLYNFIVGKAFVPPDRIAALESFIHKIIRKKGASARQWAQLIGQMGSMTNQIQLGALHRRPIQRFIQEKWNQKSQVWDVFLPLTAEVEEHLLWWSDRQNTQSGVSLQPFKPKMSLYTDASLTGFGATINSSTFRGLWDEKEKTLHINNLELLAIIKSVNRFQELLQNQEVLICTDNSTTVATINKQGGTRSWELTHMVWELWTLLDSLNCKAKARHIPGRLNVVADMLSRSQQIVNTEWTMNPTILNQVWALWGKPEVDLFANSLNFQLPLYVSLFPDPKAWKVNALLIPWENTKMYAFPPWGILEEVLLKLRDESTELILIAPAWTNRPWFPLLLQMLVEKPLKLPQVPNLIFQPHTGRVHPNLQFLNLHAWRLSSKPSKIRDLAQKWQPE